jgi:hypothetical protein
LELEHKAFDGALKQARLAVAAHLDALAVVQDAKSLRLDHLRAELAKHLPTSSQLRDSMILRLPPEDEARLLLDLTTSVVMGGDGRTYRLEEDGPHGRREVFESQSADALVSEILRRTAVAQVEHAAKPGESNGSQSQGDSWAQAAFVFLAGVIFGASALAAIAIYLKKLVF